MNELQLMVRDDLIEAQKAESISKSMVIDVLSDSEKLQIVLSNVNTYLQSELDFVKARVSDVKIPADLERLDSVRKAIAKWRVDAGKNYEAMKKANRAVISRADEGFDLVVNAQKAIEKSIEELLEPKRQEFEREKQRKKALADSLKALRTYAVNLRLSSDDIDAAIDDFRIIFGNSDYQELQDEADSIFEEKIVEFESILAEAKQREENERAVALEQARNQQRANIGVTFPLVEISGYEPRTANEIKARIDWTASIDMSAFNLVLPEAEAQKQACLNMLAAFLPMAVARENDFKRAIATQAEIDAKNARLAKIEQDRIAAEQEQLLFLADWDLVIQQYATWRENKAGELLQQAGVFESEYIGGVPVNPLVAETEDKFILIDEDTADKLLWNDKYGDFEVKERVQGDDRRWSRRWSRTNYLIFKSISTNKLYSFYWEEGLTENCEVDRYLTNDGMVRAVEIEPIEPTITIQVKFLKALIDIAEQFCNGLSDDDIKAIEHAKSLI